MIFKRYVQIILYKSTKEFSIVMEGESKDGTAACEHKPAE